VPTVSEELTSKAKLPPRLAVLVCEARPEGLYPLTRYDLREDGHMEVAAGRSKAALGLQVLQDAVAVCFKTCGELAGEQAIKRLLEAEKRA